jgi:hypothetical protein
MGVNNPKGHLVSPFDRDGRSFLMEQSLTIASAVFFL